MTVPTGPAEQAAPGIVTTSVSAARPTQHPEEAAHGRRTDGHHGRVRPDGVQGLRVETLKGEHTLQVALHGECDFSNIHELDQALRNIELDGARLVHLDLTHPTFADVATIRRLAAFAGRAKRTGHDVTTNGAHHTLRRVADMLHVQDDLALSRPDPGPESATTERHTATPREAPSPQDAAR